MLPVVSTSAPGGILVAASLADMHVPTCPPLSCAAMFAGVYAAASERYYKVAAEALRVCERLVVVLRQDVEEPVDAAMTPLAQVRS